MKPIREENAEELEKFADILERAVINLQENDRAADLDVGTLHTITLEKLPEKLLFQYIRWVKENRRVESLITLKDWTAEEAEYQIQATEIKHGLSPMESTKLTTKREGHARFVVQAMLFGTVISLRVEVFRKNGPLQRS